MKYNCESRIRGYLKEVNLGAREHSVPEVFTGLLHSQLF